MHRPDDVGSTAASAPLSPARPRAWVLVCAWLFGLVVPLVVGERAVVSIIGRVEQDLLATVQSEMVAQARREAAALEPATGLRGLLHGAELDIDWPDPERVRSWHFAASESKPIPAQHWARRLVPALTRRLGTEPLAVFVAGSDGADVAVHGNTKYFTALNRPSQKAARQILQFMGGLGTRQAWADPGAVAAAQRVTPAMADRLLRSMLGEFASARSPRGAVVGMYSPKFGGGSLWIYTRFLPASDHPHAPIVGGYLAILRDADLPAGLWLGRHRRGANWRLTRRVAALSPRFIRSRHVYALAWPLHRDTTARWADTWRLRQGSSALRETVVSRTHPWGNGRSRPPAMLLWRPLTSLVHPLRPLLPWIRIAVGLGALAMAVLLWRLARHDVRLPLSIWGKLAVATGLAVVVPIVGFWLVAVAWHGFARQLDVDRRLNEVREKIGVVGTDLAAHADFHAAAISRVRERLGVDLVRDRSRVPVRLARLQQSACLDAVHLIAASGEEWTVRAPASDPVQLDPVAADQLREFGRLFAIRSLAEYGIFTPQLLGRPGAPSYLTRSRWAIAENIGVGDVRALVMDDGAPADSGFSGLKNCRVLQFLVFPDSRRDRLPVAELFTLQRTERSADDYFARRRRAAPFAEQLECRQGDRIAFFRITDADHPQLEPHQCWPISARHDGALAEVAREGLLEARAGAAVVLPAADGGVGVVQSFDGVPWVAVAMVEPDSPVQMWHQRLLLLALALYCVVLLYVLVRYLERVFVGPIGVLSQGGTRVTEGMLDVELRCDTRDEFAQLAGEFNSMCRGLRERLRLTRFVSAEVLSTVRAGTGADLAPGGERCAATVLFAHLRDFPGLLTRRSPGWIIDLLNAWFPLAEAAVTSNGGSIDKYIGDAVMAVFSPGPQDDSAVRAARAAWAMRAALADLDRRRRAVTPDDPPLSLGIGMATGVVISGRIGSRLRRIDHTVIGDTVNLAARLESESRRAVATGIVLDAATAAGCKEGFTLAGLGAIAVKGKAQAISVFELAGVPS